MIKYERLRISNEAHIMKYVIKGGLDNDKLAVSYKNGLDSQWKMCEYRVIIW